MFDEFGPRGAEDEREGFWTDLSEVPDEQYRDEEVYLIMAAAISASLPKMRSCLDRLEEVLEMEPAIREPAAPHETGRKDAPTVSFEHVTFAYPGAEEAVIRDLSFQCRAGETTAVIGGTGAGKSTVAELLLRLHDVDAGVVQIGRAHV